VLIFLTSAPCRDPVVGVFLRKRLTGEVQEHAGSLWRRVNVPGFRQCYSPVTVEV